MLHNGFRCRGKEYFVDDWVSVGFGDRQMVGRISALIESGGVMLGR